MSARANGEGSVYLRQDGRWSAAAYVLRPDGGRVRRQVYGRTRAEASQKLTVLLSKTAAGIPLAGEAWTVRSYADHWLETVARARLRPATWTNYSYAVRVHIGPSLGSVRLRSLTPARVRRFLAERTEAGLAANSVRIIHATLRTMLAEAVRDELVERNVASIVRGPRIDHEEVRPWSLDEAATFLAAAREHRLSALFAVGVAVGLRRGELLALVWDDVDLDGGILRVRRTVQRLRGQGLVFGPPKSIRSRRSIPLPESSRAALLSYRERQEVERLTAGDSWQESGLVFTTSVGTVVEPRNLSRIFEHLVERSGVRRIRFHDLRHTCASLLLAQGVSPRVVMDVLGHSQLSITMDLYSHVMPSALRDAAVAMDRALSEGR